MGEFTFQCSIDGQDYSLKLLAMVRYQRDLHVLHEMKRAGATVEYDIEDVWGSKPKGECSRHRAARRSRAAIDRRPRKLSCASEATVLVLLMAR